MNSVLGDLLPLALGVALSPIPIIAVILMLLAPKAGGTSAGFLAGWLIGIAGVTTVVTVIAVTAGLDDGSSGSTTTVSWVKVVLGALLVGLAARQWRGRPRAGGKATLPGWMAAIDNLTIGRAAGLGLALSAINPKNLLMCVAAGTLVGEAAISGGERAGSIVLFTAVAGCTVAVPVAAYRLARERMRQPLDELKVWLEANNATVMTILLLVIGAVLIGKGFGGF